MKEIPDYLNTLANAYSIQLRHTSRIWIFASTVSLLVLTARAKDEEVTFLTHNMDASLFYPACALVLGAAYMAFCSAHAQCLRAALIYHEAVKKEGLEQNEVTDTYTLADVAHTLYPSGFNRVYPLTHYAPKCLRRVMYRVLGVVSNLVYFGFPASGAGFCVYKLGLCHWVSILVLLLLCACIPLILFQLFAWVLRKEK